MGMERISKPRKMRPQFLVLCEGETEENYVRFLRQNYRLPIEIVPKIVGSCITSDIVNRYKKRIPGAESSRRTFLMYDADVPKVLENLYGCEGILLLSKPCIEIWFMAHFRKIGDREVPSDLCVKLLKKLPGWNDYKKAILTSSQENMLWEKRLTAVDEMKRKKGNSKIFSSVFEFIQILENTKRENNEHSV